MNKHVDLQWEVRRPSSGPSRMLVSLMREMAQVDFEASRISGSAIVSLERKPSANQVLLDIDQLDIKAVFCRRAKVRGRVPPTTIFLTSCLTHISVCG